MQLESPKQRSKQRNRVNQPSMGSIDQKLIETEAEADSAQEEATSDTVIPTNLTVKQREIRSEIRSTNASVIIYMNPDFYI
jgi:hypothetical protein